MADASRDINGKRIKCVSQAGKQWCESLPGTLANRRHQQRAHNAIRKHLRQLDQQRKTYAVGVANTAKQLGRIHPHRRIGINEMGQLEHTLASQECLCNNPKTSNVVAELAIPQPCHYCKARNSSHKYHNKKPDRLVARNYIEHGISLMVQKWGKDWSAT